MLDPISMAELISRATIWQAQQSSLKPMRPHELVTELDAALTHITPVLEILGWTRTVHRGWLHGRRYRRVYWCPKGMTLYRRPRGRPSLLSTLFNSGENHVHSR
jgi:hypothetical protein